MKNKRRLCFVLSIWFYSFFHLFIHNFLGHTMCIGCIKKMMKDSTIECPLCKKITVVENGNLQNIPTNFSLKNLADERKGDFLNSIIKNQIKLK